MLLKEKKGLRYLEFELLQDYPQIRHGVFLKDTRGAHCLEFQKKVKECFEAKALIFGLQTHEDSILEIVDFTQQIHQSSDGIYTTVKDVALGVYHADCQAVLIFDPITQTIANIHCGWRGNHHNILEKAVKTLELSKGSNPKDLLVCISPSLGPDRSEFLDYEKTWPSHLHSFLYKPYHFNLWKMSEDQLIKAGVDKAHIEIAGLCTHTHIEDFHSYRRDKTKLRNATIISLY